MNAFGILGTGERLVFQEEELREAFREAGKRVHPDAGGAEGDFAALKEAMAIVSNPSRRLGHWLSLRGVQVEPRGMIAERLMDLFGKIGAVTQRAEGVIRKRETTLSALGKALLEPELQGCLEAVEEMIAEVNAMIDDECSVFPEWEQGAVPDTEVASGKVRNLAFLEKWKAALKGCYARLV